MENPQDMNISGSGSGGGSNSNNNEISDGEVIDSSAVVADDEVHVDIPVNMSRCIYRVPTNARGDRNMGSQVYDPAVVSIGPYHHGEPQYREMEQYKEDELVKFMAKSVEVDKTKDRYFYYNEIFKRINEVRKNYEKDIKYDDDEELAAIILCDACFIVSFLDMERPWLVERISTELSLPISALVVRDLLMLENQIPYWIIKHLIDLRYGEGGEDLVRIYIGWECFLNSDFVIQLPWGEDHRPLHLLEAHQFALLYQQIPQEPKPHFLSTTSMPKTAEYEASNFFERLNLPYRSVTYLQSKGIHLRPSSLCLRDIKFTSYHFYGVLHLPMLYINRNTSVLFSNIVAYEMTPNLSKSYMMTSYVNFMKSLIDTPQDVMVLREKGILYSNLGDDQEVIRVFKEIDTYGVVSDIFHKVEKEINKHCSSRTKTWMADLFHSYCRSPWSVVAVFAATLVICLTFIQTYYTVHQVS